MPTTCTFQVKPSGAQNISVALAAGATRDDAGNPSNAASATSVYLDAMAPTPTITGPATHGNNGNIQFAVVFDEDVTGLGPGDFTVAGGTVQALTGGPRVFSLVVTPSGEVDVSVTLPANAATDLNGNGNVASNAVTTAYLDESPPVITLTPPATHNCIDPFQIQVGSNEILSGLQASDFVVTNGTAVSLTGGPQNFVLTVQSSGACLPITVTLPPGSATDPGGNDNANVSTPPIPYADTTAPTVSISAPASHDGSTLVNFAVSFSEVVTGLEASDFNVTGGTATLTGSGDTYTLTVAPTGTADIVVSLPSGAAQDSSGNNNTASNTTTTPYLDAAGPQLTITGPADHDGSTPFQITINADEPITGFEIADIFITNGNVSGLSGSGAGPYTATVTPTSSNDIAVNVPAGRVTDATGNANDPSNTLTTVYVDQSAPQVTITLPADHDGATPFNVDIVFDEPVTGLELADIAVANGVGSNLTGSGTTYSMTITPSGLLDVTATVVAGAAQDATGNGSNASSPAIAVYVDSTPPTVLVSGPTSHNGSAPFTLTFTFNEPVTNFELSDILAGQSGLNITNILGGPDVYTATATPQGNFDGSIQIAAGAAIDGGSNPNTASNSLTIPYIDSANPLVEFQAVPANHDGTAGSMITIQFSEVVTGFDASDIVITGGTLSNFSTVDGDTYTIDVTPTADGDITLDIGSGAATDSTGNGNEPATQAVIPFVDSTPPSVVLSTVATQHGGTDANASFQVQAQFSENVDNFDLGDINVTDGIATGLSGSGSLYTFTITPTDNADTTIVVPAGSAQDAAGNGNTASNTLTVPYVDITAPTVTLTCPGTHLNVPFDVIAEFSEPVVGFIPADVSVTNGTVTAVTGSGTTFTISVTPSGGSIDVTLIAGVTQDSAGNGNIASSTCTTGLGDVTAPTVTLSSIGTHDGTAFEVTATFSEDVKPLLSGVIGVTNGTVSNLSGGPTVWTFDVTPSNPAAEVIVNVGAGATTDLAGNGNLASNVLTILEPFTMVLSLSSLCHDGIGFSVFQNNVIGTVSFNRAPTGFNAADIALTNGTIDNFSGAGNVYTFEVNETADADMEISIASGVATDSNGNLSPASPVQVITFEQPPIITLSGAPASHDNTPFTVEYSISGGPFVSPFTTSGFFPPGRVSNITILSPTSGTVEVDPFPDVDSEVYVVPSNIVQDAGGCRIYNPESNRLIVPYQPPQEWVTGIVSSGPQDATGVLGTIPVTLSVGAPQSLFTNNPVDMSGPQFTPPGLAVQPNWRAGLFNRTGTIHRILFGSAVTDPILHFRWWGGGRNILIDTTFTLGIEILSSSAPMTITDMGGGFSSVDSISKSGSIKFLGTYTLFNPILLSADMTAGSGGASYYFQISAAI